MKFVIMFAASVASAALVTPTVTQGQQRNESGKAPVAVAYVAQPTRA